MESAARTSASAPAAEAPQLRLRRCFATAAGSSRDDRRPGTAARSSAELSSVFSRGLNSSTTCRNQARRRRRDTRRATARRRAGRARAGRPAPRAGSRMDVLLVHPVELLGVEDRVAAADPFERERAISSSRREQLAGRRQATSRAARGSSPSPRGDSRAAGTPSPTSRRAACSGASCRCPRISGTCANDGGVLPERLIQQHLLRRVRDVIVAADDVRDPPCRCRRRRPRGGRSAGDRTAARRSPRCRRWGTRSGRGPDRRIAVVPSGTLKRIARGAPAASAPRSRRRSAREQVRS